MLLSRDRSELEKAEEHGQAALAAAVWAGPQAVTLRLRARILLAQLSAKRGEWKTALRQFQAVVAGLEQQGNGDRLAQCRLSVARCYFRLGRWTQASDCLRQALAWFVESGSRTWECHCWVALSMISLAAGDTQGAAQFVRRARGAIEAEAPPRTRALLKEVEGDIAAAHGRSEEALERYREALSLLGDAGVHDDVSTEVLHRRAAVLLEMKRPRDAFADAERALAFARKCGEPLEESASLRVRGLALAARGGMAEARTDLENALAIAVEYGDRLEEARTCEALEAAVGRSAGGGITQAEAVGHLYRARGLFASLGCARDVERLDRRLAEARERPLPRVRAIVARQKLAGANGPQLLTEDPRIISDLQRLLRAPDRVLLVGETGTGKELLAKILHAESDRRDRPFVVVDCGALALGLLESELFGFRRGTFTGAERDREGLVESTHGGTLFLDEIAELPLEMQSRLLRVVQERQIRRLGENAYRSVDFRLTAATNRNLDRMVEEGRFRSDLYFRLRGAMMIIPPLRERPGDILLLADHFFDAFAAGTGRPLIICPDVYQAFLAYSWPGNVRELISEIESLVSQAPEHGQIGAELLSPALRGPNGGVRAGSEPPRPPGTLLERLEMLKKAEIRRALERHGGNRAQAAHELGLTPQGLAKILKRTRIDSE